MGYVNGLIQESKLDVYRPTPKIFFAFGFPELNFSGGYPS